MPFAIDTVSGQREVIRSFEKHYAALREIKFSIDNGRPVQCVKAKDQAKKRKKRKSRKPTKNDWVQKTKKRVQQIKNARGGAVDNSEPTTGKGLSKMITSARRRREEVKRREHANRIRKMRRNISESHSLLQRRKNYFDSAANPVTLFRRKRCSRSSRSARQPECLQASSNFLGPRKVVSRPQTARRPRLKLRAQSARPRSAGARHTSRKRDAIQLVDDEVISFQNKIVQTIIKRRMCREEDILNYLVDEISDHLYLDEEDLLAVARYICNEFSVGIHKLHLLLSLKLQVHLEEEGEEKTVKTARRKEGKAVNIPRPTNDETQEVILASPKKLEETEEKTEIKKREENEKIDASARLHAVVGNIAAVDDALRENIAEIASSSAV